MDRMQCIAVAVGLAMILIIVLMSLLPGLFGWMSETTRGLATIILGGIPAALYERFVGARDDSTEASLWIWLAGTAVLTIPAIGNFLKLGL